jgi:hypothetical protein
MEQLKLYDEQEGKAEIENKKEKRAIFRIIRSFGKLHNIIIYIRNSAGRTKEFENLAKKTILLDNLTRWNS